MAIQLMHYQFSSEAYHRLAETGILPPDARVELINGEILEMSPIGRRHVGTVDRVSRFLDRRVGDDAIVRTQSPIVLADGQEPEPDIALLKFREDFYTSLPETPADVLLVIEVADSSLDYDRRAKAPLYARFGIPELWIADLTRDRLLVYRDPTPQGYASTQVLTPGQDVSPLAFPDLQMPVGMVFGR